MGEKQGVGCKRICDGEKKFVDLIGNFWFLKGTHPRDQAYHKASRLREIIRLAMDRIGGFALDNEKGRSNYLNLKRGELWDLLELEKEYCDVYYLTNQSLSEF
eukprot:g38473.t1